jgi:hypothetical protein
MRSIHKEEKGGLVVLLPKGSPPHTGCKIHHTLYFMKNKID